MYPDRPDSPDAECVLAIHRFALAHDGMPPIARELAEVLGISVASAYHRRSRAALHGWLQRLKRPSRQYVPVWYPSLSDALRTVAASAWTSDRWRERVEQAKVSPP